MSERSEGPDESPAFPDTSRTPPARSGPAAPVNTSARITNLDLVRGIAVLGILGMNAVSYGLGTAPYFNLDAGGSDTWLDWIIGGFGEIFLDQKFMGLFSLLFGAGIVLFADRAAQKGRHAWALSLWRNALLLGIGFAHAALWDGDVLVVYAVCAPFLILLRKRRPRTLLTAGVACVMVSPLLAIVAQANTPASGAGLGDYWFADGGSMSNAVGIFLLGDFFFRALGMMLIGVALYRTGIVNGKRSARFYKRMAVWGLGLGLPLSAAGLGLVAARDFSPEISLVGSIPNTIATIPIVMGYLGLITLWNMRPDTRAHTTLQAVGRMALTNYLTQTTIGIVVLRYALDSVDLTRSMLLAFIVVVWVSQLLWSPSWLKVFKYGPAEWLWRCATYRRWQPIRRASIASA